MPFFSILVPSYNRPEYILDLINSILEQDFNDYEIIIADDCSPKQQIIKNYLNSLVDNRIKVYFHDVNLGEVANKNFLISKASGEYNILIGDDDTFCKRSLRLIYKNIKENPDIDLYGFGYSTVDENDRKISEYKAPFQVTFSAETQNISKNLFAADMFPLWIFHPSTFCCRAGIEKRIPYSKDVGMAEDMFFIFEYLLQGNKILIIPEKIFNWRKILRKSKSDQLNQSAKHLADISARIKIYNKLIEDYQLSDYHSYFLSHEYRKRFLLSTIISDPRISREEINNNLLENKEYFYIFDDLKKIADRQDIFNYLSRKILIFQRIHIFLNFFGVLNTLKFIIRLFSINRLR